MCSFTTMAFSNPTSTTGAALPTVDQSANGYVSSSLPLPMAYPGASKINGNMDIESIISDDNVSYNTYVDVVEEMSNQNYYKRNSQSNSFCGSKDVVRFNISMKSKCPSIYYPETIIISNNTARYTLHGRESTLFHLAATIIFTLSVTNLYIGINYLVRIDNLDREVAIITSDMENKLCYIKETNNSSYKDITMNSPLYS
ncbi:hypothetical protein BD770DRAFT_412266 [Pilaira anomala]|nr:hypothetical protein BD770DRAFT_412266 [Pilaira anomala]